MCAEMENRFSHSGRPLYGGPSAGRRGYRAFAHPQSRTVLNRSELVITAIDVRRAESGATLTGLEAIPFSLKERTLSLRPHSDGAYPAKVINLAGVCNLDLSV